MDRFFTSILLLFVTVFCCVQSGYTQLAPTLVLSNRIVDSLRLANTLSAYLHTLPVERPVALYAKIKPGAPLGNPTKIQIGAAFGDQYFLIYAAPSLTSAEINDAGIVSWAPQQPADKLSNWWPQQSVDSNGLQTILIKVNNLASAASARQALTAAGVIVKAEQPWKRQQIWVGVVASGALPDLAAKSFVDYIQPQLQSQTCNLQAIGFTNAEGARQPIALGGHNLQGNGVVIGVGDNTNPVHIDYIDRVRSFNPAPILGHGIHTTGTVGGNGIIDERNKGFAPHCNLIADYFSQIISNAATYYDNFGMVLTNNSYAALLGSCSHAGVYDLYSQYLDQLAFNLPSVLNVFAAANDGRMTCSPFPLGYATVAGSYTTAKNILTVGNIGKTRGVFNQTTSCGPVKDGRLKPEITAVGTDLVSTFRGNTYRAESGTSMAAPNVTGAAGLLYERFRQLHQGQNPDNALIKCLLMNGADDLATAGPDYRYGFGLMNLGHSLRMLDSNWIFHGEIDAGQTKTVMISIPPQTAVAKIMLYWNDPPATPISTKTLVNDLDLSVTDDASTLYLPLHPHPDPGKVTLPASPRPDHINNVEQVTLKQPVAGTYKIHIAGYDVPVDPQQYYITYDLIPNGIKLQYPFGGEQLASGDTVVVYWEASTSNQPFSLAFSFDNGSSWKTLSASVEPDKRAFEWIIPDSLAATGCLIRLRRDGEEAISGRFSIMGRPRATLLSTAYQCPGSVRFRWSRVPGITQYQVFKKIQANMIPIAITEDTSYTITALSPDSTYWFSVAPIMNNITGQRAFALNFQPNKGTCNDIEQHGDLALATILSPVNGRQYTQSDFSAATPLNVLVRNQDNAVASHYRLSWKLNNQPWQGQVMQEPIPPSGSRSLLVGTLDLRDTGTYHLIVAIHNLTTVDPVSENDTLQLAVRHLRNDPLALNPGFFEGFEALPAIEATGRSTMGIAGSERWDFQQTKPFGRFRSFVNSSVTISGVRSVSLDNARNEGADITQSSLNALSGTFNLSAYLLQRDEIRCSFDYFLSGASQFPMENKVWIRGNDTDVWIPVYQFEADPFGAGKLMHPRAFSLNDVLLAAGQSFSAATQIKFTQRDTSLIASSEYGCGLTLDNFSLFRVKDDIELLSIDSIHHVNCALRDSVPLQVTLRNGVFNTVSNIQISYRLDDLPVVSVQVDSLEGKDTLTYTFSTPLNLSSHATHLLSVWLSTPSDNFRENDSINHYIIQNQKIVDHFPYIQNFEKDDGGFYAAGHNTSWAYGTPSSEAIDHAASGKKAWKTNLKGHYNDEEQSYLYSPCFDLSGLAQPMLSFSVATDLEAPGATVYDEAYVEYTLDGTNWQRLGSADEGYNWYDDEQYNSWTQPGATYWHVATIPLPLTDGTLSFRFVLKSDQAVNYNGIAIDDIHIYDYKNDIFDGDMLHATAETDIAPNEKKSFIENDQIALTILNGKNPIHGLKIQDYGHTHFINADSSQYLLPRSYTLKADATANAPVTVRFFIPGDEVKRIRDDRQCMSCSPVTEIYRIGITQYTDPDKDKENQWLHDNKHGVYSFLPPDKVSWVPFANGYRGEATLVPFSEIWFNDGGPDGNHPFSSRLFTFNAWHSGQRSVLLGWKSKTDRNVFQYSIQRADTSLNFYTVATVRSTHDPRKTYTYTDTPTLTSPVMFYRIEYKHRNGKIYYSVIRRLDWSAMKGSIRIFPNPVADGRLTIEWFKGNTANLDWTLYDLNGRVLLNGTIEDSGFTGRRTIDLQTLGHAHGVYLLKIRNKNMSWGFKVSLSGR